MLILTCFYPSEEELQHKPEANVVFRITFVFVKLNVCFCISSLKTKTYMLNI
jgi:hypothetical protein